MCDMVRGQSQTDGMKYAQSIPNLKCDVQYMYCSEESNARVHEYTEFSVTMGHT